MCWQVLKSRLIENGCHSGCVGGVDNPCCFLSLGVVVSTRDRYSLVSSSAALARVFSFEEKGVFGSGWGRTNLGRVIRLDCHVNSG